MGGREKPPSCTTALLITGSQVQVCERLSGDKVWARADGFEPLQRSQQPSGCRASHEGANASGRPKEVAIPQLQEI